jgi:hypothetical protein
MPPDPERGAGAAEQCAFASALVEKGATLSGLTDGRGRAAADRLSVYRNNVIVSLVEALEATFPATLRLVGETFFRAAARAYAEAEKPESPLLFRYGETFADHLARLPGLADYPFVPETARIEFARVGAYHAADAAPLPPDALGAVSRETLPGVVFTAHPATRLVPAPAGGVGAWQRNQDPPLPSVDAAAALVTRPVAAVIVTPLPAPSAAFAEALLAGRALGEAAAADGLDLAAALGALLSAGAFRSVRVTESP